MNVLVHAVGSPLGQSILKSLKISNLNINIFAGDIFNDAAGLFMVPEPNRIIYPPLKNNDYHDYVSDLIIKNKIEIIYPVISLEFDYYDKYKEFYIKNGVRIVNMNSNVYNLINDKFKSFEYLKNNGINIPKTFFADGSNKFYSSIKENGFPILLKPINGASSKDVFIIDSLSRLKSILNVFPKSYFIAQEYLNAKDEFTVGIYRSPYSNFEDTFVIKRELQFGLSYKGEVVESKLLSDYSLNICRIFGTDFSSNVQLKLKNDIPYVFEINPRLSSTTFIRAHFGFNEPEMIILDIINKGKNLSFNKRKGKFSRYWEEIFFDI
jgi:carbamoyl-phosphate synthase large subunit